MQLVISLSSGHDTVQVALVGEGSSHDIATVGGHLLGGHVIVETQIHPRLYPFHLRTTSCFAGLQAQLKAIVEHVETIAAGSVIGTHIFHNPLQGGALGVEQLFVRNDSSFDGLNPCVADSGYPFTYKIDLLFEEGGS